MSNFFLRQFTKWNVNCLIFIMIKKTTILLLLLYTFCSNAQGIRKGILVGSKRFVPTGNSNTLAITDNNKVCIGGELFDNNSNILDSTLKCLLLLDDTGKVQKAIGWDYNTMLFNNKVFTHRKYIVVKNTNGWSISQSNFRQIVVFDSLLNFKFAKRLTILDGNADFFYNENSDIILHDKYYTIMPSNQKIDSSFLFVKMDLNTGQSPINKKITSGGAEQGYVMLYSGDKIYTILRNTLSTEIIKIDTNGNILQNLKIIDASGGLLYSVLWINNKIDIFYSNRHLVLDTNLLVVKSDTLNTKFIRRIERAKNDYILVNTAQKWIANIDSNFAVRWAKVYENNFHSSWATDDKCFFNNATNYVLDSLQYLSIGRQFVKLDSMGDDGCQYRDTMFQILATPIVLPVSIPPLIVLSGDTFEEVQYNFTPLVTYTYNICTDTLPNFAVFTTSRDTICVGDTILFLGKYSDTLVTHTWYVDIPYTDSFFTQKKIYQFSQVGSHIVTHITQIDAKIDTLFDTIFVRPKPTFSIMKNPITICKTIDTVNITASPLTLHYHWNTGDTTTAIKTNTIGNYGVTATDNFDCSTSQTITINSDSCPPFAHIQSIPDTNCIENNIQFSDSSSSNTTAWFWTFENATPATYFGQNPPTIIFLQTGTHIVQLIASNAFGSDTVTKTIFIKLCDTVKANFTSTTQTICAGECVQFMDSSLYNPTIYRWTFAGGHPAQYIGKNPPPICYSDSGSYAVSLAVANAYSSDSIFFTNYITVFPAPQKQTVTTDFNIKSGDSITLQACAIADSYAWKPDVACANCSEITIVPTKENTTYQCTATTHSGCAVVCTYHVTVSGLVGTIYIPNAFSPNADGNNDVWEVYTQNAKVISTEIFNRWGEKVYSSGNLYPSWDGVYKNMPQPPGVYSYQISYLLNGETESRLAKGSISLIK